jgi:Ni,Fe-hydrogenase I cytochrome b subunit
MATHSTVDVHHHDNMSKMDYAEHERTYSGFLVLTKWVIVALVVLLAAMGFFLT